MTELVRDLSQINRNGAGRLLEYLSTKATPRESTVLLFKLLVHLRDNDASAFAKAGKVWPEECWALQRWRDTGLDEVRKMAGPDDPLALT